MFNSTAAKARHAELKTEAETQLIRITEALKHHGAGEPKDWAHVGDLRRLVEQLTDAANFMNDTE